MNERRFTLGQLAKLSGLARASLLNYESIGLLKPAARSAAGYRLYGKGEVDRLRAIRRFRDAGLSLAAICDLLLKRRSDTAFARKPAAILEARLVDLSNEMERLRGQQELLAQLLATPEFREAQPCHDKSSWVALLRRAGFDDRAMRQWHVRFEATSPDEHAEFLRAIGLPSAEVSAIRRRSKRKR